MKMHIRVWDAMKAKTKLDLDKSLKLSLTLNALKLGFAISQQLQNNLEIFKILFLS